MGVQYLGVCIRGGRISGGIYPTPPPRTTKAGCTHHPGMLSCCSLILFPPDHLHSGHRRGTLHRERSEGLCLWTCISEHRKPRWRSHRSGPTLRGWAGGWTEVRPGGDGLPDVLGQTVITARTRSASSELKLQIDVMKDPQWRIKNTMQEEHAVLTVSKWCFIKLSCFRHKILTKLEK